MKVGWEPVVGKYRGNMCCEVRMQCPSEKRLGQKNKGGTRYQHKPSVSETHYVSGVATEEASECACSVPTLIQ